MWNGRRPVAASNKITPNEYRSDLPSSGNGCSSAIVEVRTDAGTPLTDEALLELPANTTLHVVSARDPA